MSKKQIIQQRLLSIILFIISTSFCIVSAEFFLRIKNSNMNNYDVEMWKYSKKLKKRDKNTILDFDHIKNKKAILQKVEIRLNNRGFRGPNTEITNDKERRILFLGSSITLGWGVKENQTTTSQLKKMLEKNGEYVDVINGGIGNYNLYRSVNRFLLKHTDLETTDIVVHYFIRDAENLNNTKDNFLLKNSQLALTLWIAKNRIFQKSGIDSLANHYELIYGNNSRGLVKMKESLKKLSAYAKSKKIKLYLAMIPDIQSLEDYKFYEIHDLMKTLAEEYNYKFIDTLPNLVGLSQKEIYSMPGDPHPNALGHRLMAEKIFENIKLKK